MLVSHLQDFHSQGLGRLVGMVDSTLLVVRRDTVFPQLVETGKKPSHATRRNTKLLRHLLGGRSRLPAVKKSRYESESELAWT